MNQTDPLDEQEAHEILQKGREIKTSVGAYFRIEGLGMVAYKLLDEDLKTVKAIYIEVDGKLIKTSAEELQNLLKEQENAQPD